MSRQLKKYLKTRAVISPWKIEGTVDCNFLAAVIIPALAERENIATTLISLSANPAEYLQQTLIVVVINNRSDASIEQLENNQQTLEWLGSQPFSSLNLGWVDVSSSSLELPEREGVGLARKIGFDLSLQRLDFRQFPLLISLDADTLVDDNYLPALFRHFSMSSNGGAVLPFRHQNGETADQEIAIRHYELYLRSYLFGLQVAESPYAYHTIGSAFACTAEAYVRVGGMNRRHAAEDFYFLQQLKKVAGIEMVHGTIVYPSPRSSDRVPFGTGKVVQVQLEQGKNLYSFISVAAFRLLKVWLQSVSNQVNSSATEILARAEQLSPILRQYLAELNFISIWEQLQRNHVDKSQRLRAFHCWFDALRTRQLLFRFEKGQKESTEMLVADLLSWGGYLEVVDSSQQLELLERLQGL